MKQIEKSFLHFKIALFFSLLLLTFQVLGQNRSRGESFKKGEIIVQLLDNNSIESLCSEFSSIELRAKKNLSKDLKIWLLTYEVLKYPTGAQSLVHVLNSDKRVAVAQLNHYITQRSATTPDDPRLAEQWALNNTGQAGGTSGADIDALLAWDITTGGTTATGEELVVAVIDGGFDLDHEDINYWKNKDEIPGNGLDDDQNGYIDDYDGWNAINSNGTIASDDHGTHVAGIIGAKGNNTKGIAGINWGIKILPIQGSSSVESEVVEAYGFILAQRKRYNETNGTGGAFIVSTNASFGVDLANPADYPLWCGIYDSLGIAGVLSAGATANADYDIDTQGDIPTACASNYLVTVTNTTSGDVKASGAGYGATTIDIGSPGTDILSCTPNNSYQEMTGTSMATPYVAGTIALLYAGACQKLIEDYHADPGSFALMFKDWLMNGADPVQPLNGLTVSGGRLNAYNSLQLVQSYDCTSGSPQTSFLSSSVSVNESNTTDSSSCRKYQEVTIKMKISAPPTGNAEVTIAQLSGTLSSDEYELITPMPIIFESGKQDTLSFVIRIYDDLDLESVENLEFEYTLNGNSNATKGAFRQTFKLDIEDNEQSPDAEISQALFSEDFASGSLTTNEWITVSTEPGFSNLSVTDGSLKMDYSPVVVNYNASVTSKEFDFTGFSKTVISYKVSFDHFLGTEINYFVVEYKNVADSVWNILEVFSDSGFTMSEKKSFIRTNQELTNLSPGTFHIRFRWYGADSNTMNSVSVDDVKIDLKKNLNAENQLFTKTFYVGGSSDITLFSEDGDLVGTLKNLTAHIYGCTTVEIDRVGLSAIPFTTTDLKNHTLEKSIMITPEFANVSGNYSVSLYYNEDEIAGWENFTGYARNQLSVMRSPGKIGNISPATPDANGPGNQLGNSPSNAQKGDLFVIQANFDAVGLGGFVGAMDSLITDAKVTDSGHFLMYPNPSSGDVYINVNEPGNGKILLLDLQGRRIEYVKISKGSSKIIFNTSYLLPGIYVVQYINQNGEISNQKLGVL